MIPIILVIFGPLILMLLWLLFEITTERNLETGMNVIGAILVIWLVCLGWICFASAQPWKYYNKGAQQVSIVNGVAVVSLDGIALNVNEFSHENFENGELVRILEKNPNGYYGLSFPLEGETKYKIERVENKND